jgi:hypothetical protein
LSYAFASDTMYTPRYRWVRERGRFTLPREYFLWR